MAKERLSRGRGPRIREEEVEKMVSLYLEGKTFKAIAQEVGRHWQTVRKYAIRALQEREGHELRRDALRSALIQHFQDLASALGSIHGQLAMPDLKVLQSPGGWRPGSPDRRSQLLLQALRASHTRESPLWSWWDSWNQAREAFDRALSPLVQRVTEEMSRLESALRVSFTDDLTQVLLRRGLTTAQGFPIYDPDMLRVRLPTNQEGTGDGEELWLAQSTHLASGPGMERLRKQLSELMRDMGNWKEIRQMAELLRQMAEVKEKIVEEVEVLSLRRAFPGRCRLCPV